jgi:hypothetical protein
MTACSSARLGISQSVGAATFGERFPLVALIAIVAAAPLIAETALVVKSPMAPPEWALLERQLLKSNSEAVELFSKKYVDERGYLLHTIRWGTLDGPDDAIETYFNWTLLHALGGSDSVLQLYKKAQEGHWNQYNELRTTLTELAKNGAYYKEFITMSDWFHTGEGMRAFMLAGLADPKDEKYIARVKRFAGLYMNEDPEAPNYDPVNKVIKSMWTGSKGPMLRKATVYDWVGDPVPGSFHLLHNPAGRGRLLDLEKNYKKMLAHCDEYLDSVGDNFINLAATNLGLMAFALTGEAKYKDWVVEYVNAWKARAEQCGGMIPSEVGLDGKPGSEHKGQWWKGTYGWNFTIFDGEIERIAHRNYFPVGPWPGFSNATLLTGDNSYIDVLRRQMDLIYAQKKVENGRTLLPQMYGDPRGYKYDGPAQWYQYGPNLHIDRLTEIYLWSMNRKDLERIPLSGWIGYLEDKNPNHPTEDLKRDLATVRRKVQMIRTDITSPDTRLADYLLDFNPAATNALLNLTIGGYFSNGKIWTLHSRFRHFDPERRRAGLPEDVASLVEKLTADSATMTLVNVNPVEPRTVIVQAGGYGEHQFESVTLGGATTTVNAPLLTVRLEPGCGTRIDFKMARYKNPPTFAQPWDRGWYAK